VEALHVSRRTVRLLSSIPFLLGLLALAASVVAVGTSRTVYVLPTTGIVDNVMAGYLRDGIAKAARDGVPAVIIQLDTPGGSVEATNEIVGVLLGSTVPTIVWVAPPGSRAASAGTFITLAANIALMAPGTSIGAASPVGGQGEDIPGTLGEKVRNDAIAKMRSIAEERGRNVEWAVSTVDTAASASASDAVKVGAVDGIARSLDEVLAFADGREVTVAGRTETLELEGVTTGELGMNPFQSFLHLLSDPNIAFILFTIGFYGLLYEVISPNFVTGILGALAIILAFIGFGSLPLNVAGLLLIGLGIVLFVLELTVTSHGLLTVAGLACLGLGASALYTEPGDPTAPSVEVAVPLIITMLVTTALFMGLALWTVVRMRRRIPALAAIGYGAGGVAGVPPGTPGEVRRPLAPIGVVYAAGEEWTARSADGRSIPRGTPVVVVGQEGLTLIVEPKRSVGPEPQPSSSPA
jgi:membrane-bound serine protease (ClpP class)